MKSFDQNHLLDKIYVLNPKYILKNDLKRDLLIGARGEEGVTLFIHSIHAIILSFFDNQKSIRENIIKVEELLSIEKEIITKFILSLCDNSQKVWLGDDEFSSQFPERCLIEFHNGLFVKQYDYRDFIIYNAESDYETPRFFLPVDTILMINTKCFTNCGYCYADRHCISDLKIKTERIIQIIEEARNINMRNFEISGGEFFLCKDWEIILKSLLTNGFQPLIPTKVPLNEEIISKISTLGLDRIQISLDSIDGKVLQEHLQTNLNYIDSIKQTIEMLEKYSVKFRVNSIITSINCQSHYFDDLIEYLTDFDNLTEISIGNIGYSMYKSYEQNAKYMPKRNEIESLMEYIKTKYQRNTKVLLSGIGKKEDNFCLSKEKFDKRASCTGNTESFYILPDGKVTICEELYWHPKFIIGDLTRQSILEMWNSNEAIDLYNLSQGQIGSNSACKNCSVFNECRRGKGVCYREIMKSYGQDNWDYPDPRCPIAPELKNELAYL